MTAIIAILNKSCVAIAADSAVSVTSQNHRKVYNNANKIFNLAKGSPIAIMIHNNAEFVGIPWETIIKMYRSHSNNKKFDHVVGYRDDFISYLQSFRQYFGGMEEQRTMTEITTKILSELERSVAKRRATQFEDQQFDALSEGQKLEHYRESFKEIANGSIASNLAMQFHPGFEESDKAQLREKFHEILKEHIDYLLATFFLKEDNELTTLLIDVVMENAVKKGFVESYSGLVFTGFGELEIFPSCYSISVGGVLNDKIRLSFDEDELKISSENAATIAPFAQTDIMRTFVEGIDPNVKSSIPSAFASALKQFNDYVLSSIDNSSAMEQNLKAVLEQAVPDVVKSLVQRLEDLRFERHIGPMLKTISSLSKEDLAEMAESLINLTYLKRRASFSEESVGGPIDVAVVTKGDGFIWIKRKHYFDPALNLNYISRPKN
ncbi:MAG TPA: hypothetical protein VK658_15045 [Chryseolinea sp.]|nr:hypothetical protein [Chryseolinea sp.]